MSKLNLPPFYVGQKVVYITGKVMTKDSIHKVSDIHKNPCGCFIIAINGKKIEKDDMGGGFNNYKCIHCGIVKVTGKYAIRGGFYASSFRPYEEKPLPLLTFTQIKETEKEELLILN